MRKHIKFGLSLLVLATAFVSCDTVNEDINPTRSEKPTVNLDAASLNVALGDATPISITTSDISSKDIIFKLVQTGGNAIEGEDYSFAEISAPDYGEVGGLVTIPAYSTTGSVNILGEKNYNPAGKKATFELESIQSLIGVPGSQKEVTVTTTASTVIDIELRWAGSFLDASGAEQDWCDYDLDLEFYTAAGDFLDASYSSCPEHINIAPGDLPDGDYMIVPEFWAAGDAPAVNTQVPASLFFGVAGVGSSSEDISSTWDTDTGGYVEGNANWYIWGEYFLNISGSSYTVTNSSGAVLFQN